MFEPRSAITLDEATLGALERASHTDPFAILGPHDSARGRVVRAFLPGAKAVTFIPADGNEPLGLEERQIAGLFAAHCGAGRYKLRVEWPEGISESEDPYAFGLLLPDNDMAAIADGTHRRLDQCLGAHLDVVDGVAGMRFAVWAPNARRAAIIGDFNNWDIRRHGMRLRHEAGVWEIFIPGLGANERYKFEILGCDGVRRAKADPFARCTEAPPATASITTLPVIGVPVPLTQLEGLDSLLSIVQMPAGVPVATVGIGNAKNAGLLAARIIASAGDEFGNQITAKLDKFQVDMRQTAIDKGDALKAQLKNLATNS